MSAKIVQLLINLLLIKNTLVFADVLVELSNGIIRGRIASSPSNKTFYAFQKIPFAAPPIGNLRFQAPIPPENWANILNTTENNVICYQVTKDSDAESEDCLYLNVYTPQHPNKIDGALLPVMLYIHGGSFISGNCTINTCGPDYLIDHEVLVVTINYRLGPFGFLSTQDTVIPGNAGLKDQHMAIKWTHDNIKLFGGNPEQITIFGVSAGAASVAYQLLNKKSEGLFRAAISQSGTFLVPWALQREARSVAFNIAKLINSTYTNRNDSNALLDFLLSVSADELDLASAIFAFFYKTTLQQLMKSGIVYSPVIEAEHEGAFLTRKMFVDLKTGNFIKVPILMGFTSQECISFTPDYDLSKVAQTLDDKLDYLVPDDMRIDSREKSEEIGKLIRKIYVEDDVFANNLGVQVKFCSETSFIRPIRKHAELQSKFTNVYLYKFSYHGIMGNGVGKNIEGIENVGHNEDGYYIFLIRDGSYDNSNLSSFPEADVITQRRMLKLWTNFAKTLNPTPEQSSLFQNVTWPAVNTSDGNFFYLNIDANLKVENKPIEQTYQKWEEIYYNFGHDDFDTY